MANNNRDSVEFKTQNQAKLIGYEYLDSRHIPKDDLIDDVLTPKEIKKMKLVPLGKQGIQLIIAMTISTKKHYLDDIMAKFPDNQFRFVVISEEGFKEYVNLYDPPKVVKYDEISLSDSGENENIDDISKTLNTVKGQDILNYLISQAGKLQASDLHFETQESDVRLRFRIDGVLHSIARISVDKYRQLQSSLSVLAGISTASQDAQTGHWTHKDNGKSINMRVEAVPTNYGHDIVLRLFSLDESFLNIEKLGVEPRHKKKIRKAISTTSGMILIVGPTGSGKTTTIYSILQELNTPGRKIITLEDPVEYALPDISQIPIQSRKGKTFADGLRTVLRLDPDVIMVGEIRDADTAKTALQASLTGHLVLATFHADTAAKALTRLLDIIDFNPLLLSSIKLVMAQRLVRTLDPDSKIGNVPDPVMKTEVEDKLKLLSDVVPDKEKKLDKIYTAGKSAKNPFGYSGRSLIMEQIEVDREIQNMIRGDGSKLSPVDIEKAARKQGFVSLQEDALLKVTRGETSYEEAMKILQTL